MATNSIYGKVRTSGVRGKYNKHDEHHHNRIRNESNTWQHDDNIEAVDLEEESNSIFDTKKSFMKFSNKTKEFLPKDEIENNENEEGDIFNDENKNFMSKSIDWTGGGGSGGGSSQNRKQQQKFKKIDLSESSENFDETRKRALVTPMTYYRHIEDEEIDSSLNQTLLNRLLKAPTTVDFCLTPAPKHQVIQCRILRLNNLFQTRYVLYFERRDRNIPLLYTATKLRTKTSVYAVETSENEDAKLDFNDKDSRILVGKLTSNITKSHYELGEIIDDNLIEAIRKTDNENSIRISEVGYSPLTILNENNKVRNRNKPLDLKIFMSAHARSSPSSDDTPTPTQESSSKSKTSHKKKKEKVQNGSLHHFKFTTKQPVYVDERQAYCLDFNGRVLMTSPNNVQLVNDLDKEKIVFQMGKVADNTYICDYSYPFSAYQAFGIALAVLL